MPTCIPDAILARWLLSVRLVGERQLREGQERAAATGETLGVALVALGHTHAEALESAISGALGLTGRTRPRLGELLIARGHLTPEGLQRGLARQAECGQRLGELLVELRLCTWSHVYGALEAQSDAVRGKTPVPPEPVRETPGRRVAVVDDSPIALAMLEHGLTQAGYEVTSFSDPHQALLVLRDSPRDIILTDMEMPGMSGLELCRRLKEPRIRPLRWSSSPPTRRTRCAWTACARAPRTTSARPRAWRSCSRGWTPCCAGWGRPDA